MPTESELEPTHFSIGARAFIEPHLTIALIIVTLVVVLSASRGQASNEPAFLKINQKSKACGEVEIFLDTNGMQIYFTKSQVTLFCKALDWTVYKYNAGTKKYWVCPAAKFTNALLLSRAMSGSPSFVDVLVQKSGQKPFGKYSTNIYSTSAEFFKKVTAMYQRKEITGNYPVRMEVTALDSDKCSKEAARILSIVQLLPRTPEAAIRASGNGCDGKSYLYLTTSNMSPSPAPANWLKLPPGFNKVNEEAKLTEDKQLNENLLDFMNSEHTKH